MASQSVQNIQYWRDLVDTAAHNVTPERREQIARRCLAINQKLKSGEVHPGVWHVSAEIHGTLKSCRCFPCAAARGEK